jgi:asparagine synthase (glutamine-hydrolysing)
MGATLRLRGPDEETFYYDDNLSFVFRRLSIIDVDGGTQPIWNENQSIFVAVNGEIYNHQELHQKLNDSHVFRSQSDSEIVLHLYEEYGVKALDFLNGMYAVVIWDTSNKTLLLARDRLGIKPLYYAETEHGLLFGSELKALLMHPDCPRTFDWTGMSSQAVQENNPVSTYVKNIYHLPAGHFAFYREQEAFNPEPYWDIANYFKSSKSPPIQKTTSIENDYYELLADSVKKQLMSDVPVGLFLSGGVDSSIIAGLFAKVTKNIHCFTVVERTTYRSGDVQQAKNIAESLGLPFYPIYFDTDDIVSRFKLGDFEDLICLMESPRFDPEWLFKSELHRAARHFVPELKVILLGQGADEFCGGYSKYLGSEFPDWEDYLLHLKESISEQVIVDKGISTRFENSVNTAFYTDTSLNIYNQKMKALTYQLQHYNLWHEDRTSSYHGVESRVPFLDHRLVELLAGVPEGQQEELFWNKRIVRSVADRCLPDYPKEHHKVPFFLTDDSSSIYDFAVSMCMNIYPDFKRKYLDVENPLFHTDAMDDLFSSVQKEGFNHNNAWQLLEYMAVCVFQQYCLSPDIYLERFLNNEKQPLPIVRPDDWQEIQEKYEAPTASQSTSEWTLKSGVNIPDGCEIMNLLTEEEGSTGLILLCQGNEKNRIHISDDNDWVVMLLDAMGRYTNEPKDIEFWAQKTGVKPDKLVDVLHNLVHGGFLVRV